MKEVSGKDGASVRYRYGHSGHRVVREASGPKGSHRTVYVDALAEERDGVMVDYVFDGPTRIARLGGVKPVLLAALPPGLTGLALASLAAAVLARSRRRWRKWSRAFVAIATTLAFTLASCTCHPKPPPQPPENGTVFYHQDGLGGVGLQTDDTGSVVAEPTADPFGAPLAATSEPYGFTGKEYEAELGLIDFGARLYDPAVGRFLSADPEAVRNPLVGVNDPQALNPYSYARNSPTTHVDPTGKWIWLLFVAAALAVGVKNDQKDANLAPLALGAAPIANAVSAGAIVGGWRSNFEGVKAWREGRPAEAIKHFEDAQAPLLTGCAGMALMRPPSGTLATGTSIGRVGFHATDSKNVPLIKQGGFRTDLPNPQAAWRNNRFGRGVYMADSPEGALAERPGSNAMLTVEADVGKTLDLTARGPIRDSDAAKAIARGARKHGFDSLTVQSVQPGGGTNTVVFEPQRVKITGVDQ